MIGKLKKIKTEVSGNLDFFFSMAILPVWNALVKDKVSWTWAWTRACSWAVLVSATILVSLFNFYILIYLWGAALVSISPDQNNWSILTVNIYVCTFCGSALVKFSLAYHLLLFWLHLIYICHNLNHNQMLSNTIWFT